MNAHGRSRKVSDTFREFWQVVHGYKWVTRSATALSKFEERGLSLRARSRFLKLYNIHQRLQETYIRQLIFAKRAHGLPGSALLELELVLLVFGRLCSTLSTL